MSQRIVTITVTAFLALTPAAALADGADPAAVEHCLTGIWGAPPRYLDSVHAQGELDKVKSCDAAARALLAAGDPARPIKLPDGKTQRLDWVVHYIADRNDASRVSYLRGTLEKAQATRDWYDTVDGVGENELMRIEGDGQSCARVVDEVAAMGLGATVSIELKPQLVVPFGQVKGQLCDVLTGLGKQVRQALADQAKAELDKQLAPFRKVLTGDKIRVYVDDEMYRYEMNGKGGTLLEQPEDFKGAALWFTVLGKTDDLGRDWWILRRYQFKGDKLVGRTEQTGLGSTPPTSKYR